MKKILYSIFTGTLKKFTLISMFLIGMGVYSQVSAQTIGDYKSVASGNWTTLATWQRYNGTSWVTPIAGEGWPGQYSAVPDSVWIQSNTTVTAINLTTTYSIGILHIDGRLSLSSSGNNYNNNINTLLVRVSNYVNGSYTNASIYFDGKAYLNLPAEAFIKATPLTNLATQPDWLLGSCNNNDEIIIGTVAYAVCAGVGSDSPIYSFTEVMQNGGTFLTMCKILPNPAITCVGEPLQLNGNPVLGQGAVLTQSWVGSPALVGTLYPTNTQTTTFTPSQPGTYTVTYSVTDSYNPATNTITITVLDHFAKWKGATSDWNTLSNWTCLLPNSTTDVTIPAIANPIVAPVVMSADAVCNNLNLNGSSSLTINADKTLTVNGNLTLNATSSLTINAGGSLIVKGNLINNGTLTIQSNATKSGSLIVNGSTNTGTGAVTYNRNVATNSWYMLSSPLDNNNAQAALSGSNVDRVWNDETSRDEYNVGVYNEAKNDWDYTTTLPIPFEKGKGYIVKLNSGNNVGFTGSLNNSDVSVNVQITDPESGWNAVGNPFTSAIKITEDVNGFLDINEGIIDQNFSGIYLWSTDASDYKVINKSHYNDPYFGYGYFTDDVVQAGQAFLINVKANGTVIFNKGDATVGGIQVPSTSTSLKKSETSWSGITLLATNNGHKSSTVVAFNENMTTGLDKSYDAGLLSSSDFNLYTHLVEGGSETGFAIQCLPDNMYESLVVPVGIDLPQASKVTFKVAGVKLPEGFYPVIEDRLLQVSFPLKNETDSLTVSFDEPTSGTGRFYLSFGRVLKMTGLTSKAEAGNFAARFADQKITLFGTPEQGSRAWLYDINGRKMSGEYRLTSANQNDIPAAGLSSGIYLLRIEGKTEGQTIKVSVVK